MSSQLGLRLTPAGRSIRCIRPGVLMFSTKWLNNNVVIGAIFSVLAVLNAFFIANGYYR